MNRRCLLLVLGLASVAWASVAQVSTADPLSRVMVLNGKDSPVHIKSWTLATDDRLSEIKLENTSSKEIAAVEFSWLADSPPTCNANASRLGSFSGSLPLKTVRIAPNQITAITQLGFNWIPVKDRALTENRAYIEIDVFLTKVVFSDGSDWQHQPPAHISARRLALLGQFCEQGRALGSNELQARSLQRSCGVGTSTATVSSAITPYINDPLCSIDSPCDCDPFWDVTCDPGGGEGGGGDTPPPPSPKPGWVCQASEQRTACAVDTSKNTCTNMYCADGDACAAQICVAIR